MRKFVLIIALTLTFLLLSDCSSEKVEKPVMINPADTLLIPLENLAFQNSGKQWEAVLLSPIQPIPLTVGYNDDEFFLTQKNNSGVIEGPAQILLSCGDDHFYYNVYLKNRAKPEINIIDYRSPKTVNIDSSRLQQKILIAVDKWRNISDIAPGPDFFEEEKIMLSVKTGTFRAQQEKSLSSYYIQPGSCSYIPVSSNFISSKLIYNVTAGPLQDDYGNTIADGTLVTFIYDDGKYTYRREAFLLNGYATTEIPAEDHNEYILYAKVNKTESARIELKP